MGRARSYSRDTNCPRFANSLSLRTAEGAGKAGRWMHPQSRVRRVLQKGTRVELQVQPRHPGLPRTMVVRLIRALPGEAAFLAPVVGRNSADVAPGSRRQDHTISPSAAFFRPAPGLDPFRKPSCCA